MKILKRKIVPFLTKPDDQELITEYLASLGYEILAYQKDGLSQADLLILDVQSASEIGQQVLTLKQTVDTFLPVIVVLGKDDDISAWLSAGFDDCLRKPFTNVELKANVEILLRLRQQSEELARRSEAKYQAILEATGTATLIVEEDATIIMANKTCLPVTGYSPEELLGTKWTKYVAPESLEMMLRYHKLRREDPKKAPSQYEVKLVNKAGEVRNAILQVGMVAETRQSVVSMLDITERKRAEIELNKQREILQKVFDNIPIMIAYFDERGNIKTVNNEIVKRLGWSLDDWKTENILAKCFPEPEALQEALDFMISKPIGWKDFKGTTKYGTAMDASWMIILLSDGFSMAIGQDITERKRAEEKEAQQQQLLEAINLCQQSFILDQDPCVIFDNLLAYIIEVTDSEYGFIGEVLLTTEGQPYLKTYAITNIAWNDETRKFYDENSKKGLEFYNLKTLFGYTLSTGEPVISNDPHRDPRRGGLPKGHPPLKAYLGLPIKFLDKIVAMVGIANRPGGYDNELINFLQPLLNTIGYLTEAMHNERERKRA